MTQLGAYTQGTQSAPRFTMQIPARPIGSRVHLSFSLYPDSRPLQLSGEGVRIATSGFAVRFTDVDPRNRKLLEAALLRVAALRTGKPRDRC